MGQVSDIYCYRPTVCVRGLALRAVGLGRGLRQAQHRLDSAWEQVKLEATLRELLDAKRAPEFPASSVCMRYWAALLTFFSTYFFY
jgi:hypothetical protein